LKTIGLLGGMSWESTDLYYQQINKMVQMKLGKLHSAKVVLISVDFAEIEELQHKGLWDEAGLYLKDKAIQLEKGGAMVLYFVQIRCIKWLLILRIQLLFHLFILPMQQLRKF
jgi:Aspartate racemase